MTTAVFDTQPATSQTVVFDDLRLSASDSELTSVATKSFRIMRANQTPAPNPGENQSITLPGTATLSGLVADDNYVIVLNGIPISRPLTSVWLKVSGPGSVTFSPPDALATTATFSASGVYVLRLKASDTEFASASDVTITVNAVTPINHAPVVSAGLNQTTTMPYNTITLNGAAAAIIRVYSSRSVIKSGPSQNGSAWHLSADLRRRACSH